MTRVAFKKIMNFIKHKLDKVDEQTRLNTISIGLSKKNLLMNTFTMATVKGVTATSNPDGSIVLDGTNTGDAFIIIQNLQTGIPNNSNSADRYKNNRKWIPSGNYIISGRIENKVCTQVRLSSKSDVVEESYGSTLRDVPFTITDEHKYVWCDIYISEGATFKNETIYPMVRPVTTDSTWEPFVPDLQYQITKYKEQTLIDTGLQRINFLKNGCKDKTAVGIDFTVDDNGIITLNGNHTNTQASVVYWNMASGSSAQTGQYTDNVRNFPAGTYILSGGVEGVGIQICVAADESQFQSANSSPRAVAYQDEVVVVIAEEENYVWFRLRVLPDTTFENVKMYPMLRPIEIKDNTYEPYRPSLQEQIEDLRAQISILSSKP